MADATTVSGLPFPEGTDANNVPLDMSALAEALDKGWIRHLTSTEIAALAAGEKPAGVVVFNTTTSKLQISNGSAFVDVTADSLPLSGGTLTGPLTLDGDPTSDLHAATKQYVDGAFDHLGKAATYGRSATLATSTSVDTGVGGWSVGTNDAGLALFSGGDWIFQVPVGRWRVSYSVLSDLSTVSGLIAWCGLGPWLGTSTPIPASYSHMQSQAGYAGGGAMRNTASFWVDVESGSDALIVWAKSVNGARNVTTGSIQFERVR